MEEVDKVAKPLIESASEEGGAAISGLVKAVCVAAGVALFLFDCPATAPSSVDMIHPTSQSNDNPQPQTATNTNGKQESPQVPSAQNSSKKYTRDKQQADHPSRIGDKLRNKPNWQPKKKAGGQRSPGSFRDKNEEE
jgi:hypothetical protein